MSCDLGQARRIFAIKITNTEKIKEQDMLGCILWGILTILLIIFLFCIMPWWQVLTLFGCIIFYFLFIGDDAIYKIRRSSGKKHTSKVKKADEETIRKRKQLKITNKEKARQLDAEYGNCTKVIKWWLEPNTDLIRVYEKSRVVAINYEVYNFSDILSVDYYDDVYQNRKKYHINKPLSASNHNYIIKIGVHDMSNPPIEIVIGNNMKQVMLVVKTIERVISLTGTTAGETKAKNISIGAGAVLAGAALAHQYKRHHKHEDTEKIDDDLDKWDDGYYHDYDDDIDDDYDDDYDDYIAARLEERDAYDDFIASLDMADD